MPDYSEITSAVDKFAASLVAAEKTKYEALAAEFNAYKASHPDIKPEPTPTPVPPVVTPPTGTDPKGWKLKYATTFTDLNGWTLYDNQTQSNDHSVNLKKNVSAGPKGLTIASRRESGYSQPFTSGEIVGKSTNLLVGNYFRAEVVGTFRDESGVWPCLLWYRPNNASDGEIDVMEWMGGQWSGTQKRVAVTMHNEYDSTHSQVGKPMLLSQNSWYDPNVEHTYTIEKVPGSITISIDGKWSTKFTSADKTWWNRIMEVSDRTWYPRITSQIGSGASTKVVPDPAASWSGTELNVRSYKTWTQV